VRQEDTKGTSQSVEGEGGKGRLGSLSEEEQELTRTCIPSLQAPPSPCSVGGYPARCKGAFTVLLRHPRPCLTPPSSPPVISAILSPRIVHTGRPFPPLPSPSSSAGQHLGPRATQQGSSKHLAQRILPIEVPHKPLLDASSSFVHVRRRRSCRGSPLPYTSLSSSSTLGWSGQGY
jgi:hypothetical protein